VSAVKLQNIVKKFGDFTAVHPMSLEFPEGSFVTFLGPSGCGKTTTLRMVAGLLDPSEGDIYVGDRQINDTPIHKRNLGVVFQNYALFPHKTVAENVAFGLKYRDVSKQERQKRVQEALELVQLPHLAQSYPKQLSGGQQQRIALARAIVIEPDVLLLDEPLSALDANLREDMRVELKRIQEQIGITTIFVTHDQSEALAMSDILVVMSNGRVEQVGAPEEIYTNPTSCFVADFLGTSNILKAEPQARDGQSGLFAQAVGFVPLPEKQLEKVNGQASASLVIRAEKIQLLPENTPSDDRIEHQGRIEAVDYQGQLVRYFVDIQGHKFQVLNMLSIGGALTEGQTVSVRFRPEDCIAIGENT
jgi:putative spermidine/putrescine transport system ATP-binding protein